MRGGGGKGWGHAGMKSRCTDPNLPADEADMVRHLRLSVSGVRLEGGRHEPAHKTALRAFLTSIFLGKLNLYCSIGRATYLE